MKNVHKILIPLIAIMATSCGYHLGSGPTVTPGNIKSVAVPVFENYTVEPELGAMLAGAMRKEITRRGMIALRPAGEAEAVLRGAAIEIEINPLSFDGKGFTTAYRVKLRVVVTLVRGEEILWKADDIEKDEQIIVGELPADNIVRRKFALERVAADIADVIHTAMVEGF